MATTSKDSHEKSRGLAPGPMVLKLAARRFPLYEKAASSQEGDICYWNLNRRLSRVAFDMIAATADFHKRSSSLRDPLKPEVCCLLSVVGLSHRRTFWQELTTCEAGVRNKNEKRNLKGILRAAV